MATIQNTNSWNIFLLVISASLCTNAFSAGIETDKTVGLCVVYTTITNNPGARNAALKMADKPDRAIQFAKTELNKLARWRDEGKWTESVQNGYAISGNSACRNIGIRPGDYK